MSPDITMNEHKVQKTDCKRDRSVILTKYYFGPFIYYTFKPYNKSVRNYYPQVTHRQDDQLAPNGTQSEPKTCLIPKLCLRGKAKTQNDQFYQAWTSRAEGLLPILVCGRS